MENLKSKTAWTLAILGVILVTLISSTTAYYVGNSRNEDVKKDLQSQIDSMKAEVASIKSQNIAITTPTPSPTATPDVTANWKTLKSEIINLSFKYPTDSSYAESQFVSSDGTVLVSGHKVNFIDQNKKSISFSTVTSDLNIQNSSIPQDNVTGAVNNINSFTLSYMYNDMTRRLEVAPGMYQITGFMTPECSPSLASYLIVKAPAGSGLKYIEFYLGAIEGDFATADFAESDVSCLLKTESFDKYADKTIASEAVKTNLAQAISIAKTFSVK